MKAILIYTNSREVLELFVYQWLPEIQQANFSAMCIHYTGLPVRRIYFPEKGLGIVSCILKHNNICQLILCYSFYLTIKWFLLRFILIIGISHTNYYLSKKQKTNTFLYLLLNNLKLKWADMEDKNGNFCMMFEIVFNASFSSSWIDKLEHFCKIL